MISALSGGGLAGRASGFQCSLPTCAPQTIFAATATGYGVFRDELYYVACSRHLDWGYVDHPPLVALIAKIFGPSWVALRLVSAVAFAATVVLAGDTAKSLGGGPFARIAAHGPVSVLGLDLAIVFELLGVGVIAFGALCGWVASRETLPQGWARVIFAADLAWVAASVLVLAVPATWSIAGFVGIGVVALIVADLAILEYLGLRRLGAAN